MVPTDLDLVRNGSAGIGLSMVPTDSTLLNHADRLDRPPVRPNEGVRGFAGYLEPIYTGGFSGGWELFEIDT